MDVLARSLADPLWPIGGGITALLAIILVLFIRSAEWKLSPQQRRQATVRIFTGMGCCWILLSVGVLGSHLTAAPSFKENRADGTTQTIVAATPTATPTPSPLPVLEISTVEVVTRFCDAINQQDMPTMVNQYTQRLQQKMQENQTKLAVSPDQQLTFVQCQVVRSNEQSVEAILDLLSNTPHGSGTYEVDLQEEDHTWKIDFIGRCTHVGCLDVTDQIVP